MYHICQEWRHAINCYAHPVYLKCAKEHLTKDCKKPKSEPAKCANCSGNNSANATICEAYKRRLKRIEKTQETKMKRKQKEGTSRSN